ncbi:hypothetical protein ASF71_17940 [Deinococcus sp. Leaf326]|nr:hypothetical protein ASF71_17940 [Deinococcus sp. Leaf326]
MKRTRDCLTYDYLRSELADSAGITIEEQDEIGLLRGREFFGSAMGMGSASRFLAVPSEACPPDADGDFSDAKLVHWVVQLGSFGVS